MTKAILGRASSPEPCDSPCGHQGRLLDSQFLLGKLLLQMTRAPVSNNSTIRAKANGSNASLGEGTTVLGKGFPLKSVIEELHRGLTMPLQCCVSTIKTVLCTVFTVLSIFYFPPPALHNAACLAMSQTSPHWDE